MSTRIVRWLIWPAAAVVFVGLMSYFVWRYTTSRRSTQPVNASVKNGHEGTSEDPAPEDQPEVMEPPSVKVVHPRGGAMDRITVQLGTVKAYESVNLHAKVSGYLKTQSVDIGDRVKAGKVLAIVDVPELEKQADRNAALVKLARTRVDQMKAKVKIATADKDASEAQIGYAEANAKAANALLAFRAANLKRMKALFKDTSIEEPVLDESVLRHDAARESENSAKAAVVTARAQVASCAAKILLAEADVGEAEAQVKVAQADLERTQVQLAFANIIAPFDGIITQRTLFPGDFVRSAGEGGTQLPLLTIQRTDRMRIIVKIPDRDVPFADKDDPAFFEIDAFPGEKFPGKISRVGGSEEEATRLMPVEIDLENPKNRIRQGMFGRATIILDKAVDKMSIPRECLVGRPGEGKGTVYVVKGDKAYRTTIKVGLVQDARVEVLGGLRMDDHVVFMDTPAALSDGIEVQATLMDEQKQNGNGQP